MTSRKPQGGASKGLKALVAGWDASAPPAPFRHDAEETALFYEPLPTSYKLRRLVDVAEMHDAVELTVTLMRDAMLELARRDEVDGAPKHPLYGGRDLPAGVHYRWHGRAHRTAK